MIYSRLVFVVIAGTWYGCTAPDSGGDSKAPAEESPDADGDGVDAETDCDDTDPLSFPGAAEVCDGLDNDCDGAADNGLDVVTWYADADGDSYGDAGVTQDGCSAPAGYTDDAMDCDDGDGAVHPGVVEVCNEVDDDCDGAIDQGVGDTYYRDADMDGFGTPDETTTACELPTGYSAESGDCDDTLSAAHFGATEVCDDVDNDCDGEVDEALRQLYYLDGDGDTFGDAGVFVEACAAPGGYVANATDCDDAHSAAHPGATEVCDEIDDDCDGDVDEGVTVTYYQDGDGDGYGDAAYTDVGCTAPSGFVGNATDCDDTRAAVYPAATETCDDLDDDCDGTVDEGVTTTYYRDGDGDGYGGTTTADACSAPVGYVLGGTDCDDAAADVHPSATESCNGTDDDCDASVDEGVLSTFYQDVDGDGFGGTTTWSGCDAPSGYSADGTDCDDAEETVFPGAEEVLCDGTVQGCGGSDGDVLVTAAMDLPASNLAAAAGEVICVEPGRYYAPIEIDTPLTIIAVDGADATTIVGDTTARSITISAPNTTLRGFTITDGDCGSEMGGGIYITDANNTVVEECIVTENVCDEDDGYGGGIGIENSSGVKIRNNTISANTAYGGGGVCIVDTAIEVEIEGNVFDSNTSTMQGGGLYILDSVRPTVDGNTFQGNQTGDWGGGLFTQAADGAIVTDNTFSGNYSGWAGGGMLINENADITVEGNTFSENEAYLAGGALTLYESDRTTIGQNDLDGNVAAYGGGGVFVLWSAGVTLQGLNFTNNLASGGFEWGGGLYVEGSTGLILDACSFSGNSATLGGAAFLNGSYDDDFYYIFVSDSSTLVTTAATVSANEFSSNDAATSGGGVYLYRGTGDSFEHNTFSDNTAANGAGAYWDHDTSISTTGNTFTGNLADTYGGGAYLNATVLHLISETYTGNSASNGGGLYCYGGGSYTSDTMSVFSGNTPNPADGC